MAKQEKGALVIKKVKKGHHDDHHGGAWKVAYADFVTAMMAFFLLLWLLNVTTDVQKRGIADYFEPSLSLKSAPSGAGGMLGGRVIGTPGAALQNAAAPSISAPIPAMRQPDDGDEGDDNGAPTKADNPDDPNFEKRLAEREERQFAAAEHALRQAIQDVPDLKNLAENLVIDRTSEGLRIQLVDQDRNSMFALGSSEMSEPARKLMAQVAQVVQKLPNKISITGHTDSTPFNRGGRSGYGNWELSTERANASRRELNQAGLPPERIARVVGMADRDPLVADDPASPRNRRISIVLLREAKPPAPAKGTVAQR
jgi:chemotaxis protein MotB